MKALDLFCGVGGASMGMAKNGLEVIGVDKKSQPNYPFEFLKCDVFDLPMEFFEEFDFIWASPPCQGYIHTNKKKDGYDRLIPQTRRLLQNTKKPFIIENVPSDYIRKDVMLCGEMFGLKVLRHRFFEIEGFHVEQIKHLRHKGFVAKGDYVACYTGGFGNDRTRKKYPRINFTFDDMANALEIDWAKDIHELTEAIPPAYSGYLSMKMVQQTSLPLIREVKQ